MSGFTIKVDGLGSALGKLDVTKYKPQIQQSFDKFGFRVEETAKQLAPADEGHLKGAIFSDSGELAAIVGCSVEYAAYLEFGTRSFAAEYVSTLPASWQELAASKRGSGGGSFEEFVRALTEWVIRKGFAAIQTKSGNASKSVASISAQHQAAYLIARSILRKGIRPHPYLYPAVREHTKQLLDDLKNIKVT